MYYKPQVPREFREDRKLDDKRYEEKRRSDEDSRRYDRPRGSEERRESRYSEERKLEPKHQEGRNYRKELLERFADMDFEEHHEFRSHQRYYD